MKRFEYTFAKVNELAVQMEQDKGTGKQKVRSVLVHDEPLQPTDRFWTSLYSRFGFSGTVFKYFEHGEVFERISANETDRVRLCIERDDALGTSRLLAISSPTKPIVQHDDLMETLGQYNGQAISYAEGIFESTHSPRIGSSSFSICGDDFSNRFVMSVPIDGYGLPNIYLSLLRHICSNGAIGYAKAFRSSLALGSGNDNVKYSIVRALDGFGNDEGFAALRQRFEAAGNSWASVYEAQSYYKQLVKLLNSKNVQFNSQPPSTNNQVAGLLETGTDQSSPIISAFHNMTGDVSQIYGLSNPDALSVKRQRTLPVKCTVYDMLNFASEVATHHANEHGSRSSQAWIGNLISREYDIEGSRTSYGEFQDFFLDRKLNGESAMELQSLAG